MEFVFVNLPYKL